MSEYGYAAFGTLSPAEIEGAVMTHIRGIKPSVCQLRVHPNTMNEANYGDLYFGMDGIPLLHFRDCAIDEGTMRVQKGRTGPRWDLKVYDRRWRWRYGRITGEYNLRKCDGTFVTAQQKGLRDLVLLCFQALGENAVDASVLPNNVYPYVNWRSARPALQIAWLCESVGCDVTLNLDNTVSVVQLGVGANLPAVGMPLTDTSAFLRPGVLPRSVVLDTAGTIYQSELDFSEAVGLEEDGTIVPIDSLSYKPTDGWEDQWWNGFPDVDADKRHLAFMSVYKWYRLAGQADGSWQPDGVEADISSRNQYVLYDHLAESSADGCHEPVVTGVFWPYCDLKYNTAETERYTGNFRLNTQTQCLEFEYPVIQWSNQYIAPAELTLTTSYRLVSKTGGYVGQYTYQWLNMTAPLNTPPRAIHLPWLRDVKIIDSVYGGTGYSIGGEANVYLSRMATLYTMDAGRDVLYGGDVIPMNLDGAISQIQWSVGHRRVPSTRIGRNREFDIYTPHRQNRRAMERVQQMADERGW